MFEENNTKDKLLASYKQQIKNKKLLLEHIDHMCQQIGLKDELLASYSQQIERKKSIIKNFMAIEKTQDDLIEWQKEQLDLMRETIESRNREDEERVRREQEINNEIQRSLVEAEQRKEAKARELYIKKQIAIEKRQKKILREKERKVKGVQRIQQRWRRAGDRQMKKDKISKI